MALKHIIKHSETEIVFKCYATANGGSTIDLSLQNEMTKSTQVYVAPTSVPDETGVNGLGPLVEYTGSRVFITGIWWGCRQNQRLDITRIISTSPSLVEHGHYYLRDTGFYDFTNSGGGFSDRVYANKDIRLVFDGPGHCIIRLRKQGWVDKIEPVYFGSYDDPTVVGS
jgi:hypothetical protein